MASSAGFSVVISATDRASQKIDLINRKLASMRAPVERVQRSLNKFADLTGITRLGKGMRDLARFGLEAFRSIGRIVAPLGAITGAASIAGIIKLTTAWADFGARLGFTATRIGLTVGGLQSLEGAARLAGASGQSLASGMQTLKDNLTNAVAGRAPEFISLMNSLQLAWKNADGSARNLTEVLPEIADKIAAIADPTIQARIATQAFGGAGEDLLPFLRLGAAGIAEYNREAARYGVLNKKAADAANELRRRQIGLSLAVEGLGNAIAQKLAPVLGPLLTQMADWIAANRDWIATGIGERVQEFGEYMKSIDWTALGKGVRDFATEANNVAKALGGWVRVTETLFALWAGAKFLVVLAGVTRFAAAIATIRGAGAVAAATGAGGAGTAAAGAGGLAAGLSRFAGPLGAFLYTMRPSTTNTGERDFLRDHRTEQLVNYFTSQGWTPQQAAGIVANFGAESKLHSSAEGDNGQAYGIGQWHPDRQALFKQLFGHPMRGSSLEEQAKFAQWELTHTEKAAGDRLRNAGTAAEAGAITSQYYERPADVHGEAARRAEAAEKLMARLDAAPANINGGTGSPAASSEQTVRGSVDVNIRHASPPGTKVTATSSGDAFSGPPKIAAAMTGAGP